MCALLGAVVTSCVYRTRQFVPDDIQKVHYKGWAVGPSVYAYKQSRGADYRKNHYYTLSAVADNISSELDLRIDSFTVDLGEKKICGKERKLNFSGFFQALPCVDENTAVWIPPEIRTGKMDVYVSLKPRNSREVEEKLFRFHIKKDESWFIFFPLD